MLSDKMNIEVDKSDVNLMDNGYLDSLSFIRMLTLIEEEFDVLISMDELDFEHFQSVDGIAAFVEEKVNIGKPS